MTRARAAVVLAMAAVRLVSAGATVAYPVDDRPTDPGSAGWPTRSGHQS